MTATKAHQTVILSGEDGSWLLVRGDSLPEVLAQAHAEAASDDYVLTEPEMVRLGWLRAVPCRPGPHEIDGCCCEGDRPGTHYIDSAPGSGAFQGATVEITFAEDLEDDDPRKARYLAECAAMEASRA
jgi:hypothetical protein